jgi:hypothetical protein
VSKFRKAALLRRATTSTFRFHREYFHTCHKSLQYLEECHQNEVYAHFWCLDLKIQCLFPHKAYETTTQHTDQPALARTSQYSPGKTLSGDATMQKLPVHAFLHIFISIYQLGNKIAIQNPQFWT